MSATVETMEDLRDQARTAWRTHLADCEPAAGLYRARVLHARQDNDRRLADADYTYRTAVGASWATVERSTYLQRLALESVLADSERAYQGTDYVPAITSEHSVNWVLELVDADVAPVEHAHSVLTHTLAGQRDRAYEDSWRTYHQEVEQARQAFMRETYAHRAALAYALAEAWRRMGLLTPRRGRVDQVATTEMYQHATWHQDAPTGDATAILAALAPPGLGAPEDGAQAAVAPRRPERWCDCGRPLPAGYVHCADCGAADFLSAALDRAEDH